MKLDVHIYNHPDRTALAVLGRLERMVKTLADKFDVLVEEVAAEKTVIDGVVTLLERLDEQLADAKDDPEQIEAIRTDLAAQRQRLADAVVAHTPSQAPAAGAAKSSK